MNYEQGFIGEPLFPNCFGDIGHEKGNAAVKKTDCSTVMGFLLRTL